MKDRTLEELIEMLVKQYEVNDCSFDAIERLHTSNCWYVGYIGPDSSFMDGARHGTPRKAVEAELIRLAAVNRERIEARLKEIDAEIAGLVSERGLLALAFNKNDG